MVPFWARGHLLAIPVPIRAPAAQPEVPPQIPRPRWRLLPGTPLPGVQPLRRCRVPPPCPLPQGRTPAGSGSGRRERRQRGAGGADNPRPGRGLARGGHSTPRCLREPRPGRRSRLPLRGSHLARPLHSSPLPSGAAVAAEAGIGGIASQQQETLCLSSPGGGSVSPLRPQQPAPAQPAAAAAALAPPAGLGTASPPGSGRTRSRTMRPQNLRRVRDAALGLGAGRLWSSASPPHQHLPGPRQAPLGAKVQPGRAGEVLGQNSSGREGSKQGHRGTYPIPALGHGEEAGGRGCSGRVGQARGPGAGHGSAAGGGEAELCAGSAPRLDL